MNEQMSGWKSKYSVGKLEEMGDKEEGAQEGGGFRERSDVIGPLSEKSGQSDWI